MRDILGPKYTIGDLDFSIQYMHRKGFSTMKDPHFHSFYEIYYLLQGERIYFINGQVYTAQRGDMIVINPYDVHRTTSSNVPEFERILINFSHEFVNPELSGTGKSLFPFEQGSRLIRFSLKEQPDIEKLIRELLNECKNEDEGYSAYVQASLTKLLISIYRHTQKEDREPTRYAHPMHEKITEIATFLNNHYDEDISLKHIAEQFFISPSYLSRIFKKITGFHFREFLQVVRVKEAQRMLRETKEKVLTIAEKTGFGQVAHFNTTFKKIAGVTPLRYRKQSGNPSVQVDDDE